MAAAKKAPMATEKNIVHTNAIMGEYTHTHTHTHTLHSPINPVETIQKEEFHQKLFTDYTINPYNSPVSLTGKPNVKDHVDQPDREL